MYTKRIHPNNNISEGEPNRKHSLEPYLLNEKIIWTSRQTKNFTCFFVQTKGLPQPQYIHCPSTLKYFRCIQGRQEGTWGTPAKSLTLPPHPYLIGLNCFKVSTKQCLLSPKSQFFVEHIYKDPWRSTWLLRCARPFGFWMTSALIPAVLPWLSSNSSFSGLSQVHCK